MDRVRDDRMPIRILLVEPYHLYRASARVLLDSLPDMVVVGEADGTDQVALQGPGLAPDVVVLGAGYLDGGDRHAVAALRRAHPRSGIVVLGLADDAWDAIEAIRLGATCYVVKDCSVEELSAAVRQAYAGETYLCGRFLAREDAADLVARGRVRPTPQSTDLTTRQRKVAELVATGHTNREVASHLGVRVKTAENHRRRVMEKLHLRSRAELFRYAMREGIVHVGE